MNGWYRNSTKNGYASKPAASPSHLMHCLFLGMVCYSALVTMIMLSNKASSSIPNEPQIRGRSVVAEKSRENELESTIRYLKLQVEELSSVTGSDIASDIVDHQGGGGVNPKTTLTPTNSVHKVLANKLWETSNFTLESFEVAGVNLASYGLDVDDNAIVDDFAESYSLFDDFDIAGKINGDETWSTLVRYRRSQRNLNLPFYLDKVAVKRWLPSIGMPIPKIYYTRYHNEIPDNDAFASVASSVLEMLPRERNYVAKPSHLRGMDGIVLVGYSKEEGEPSRYGRSWIGREGQILQEADPDLDVQWKAATVLSKHFDVKRGDLSAADGTDDSPWSLSVVTPGLVIEERIALWDNDKRPAMQFQFFVIWGRVYIARWNRGLSPWGIVTRDGKVMKWVGMSKAHVEVPEYVDWEKLIEIAERLGANKDMIRVDLFVGVSADDRRSLDHYRYASEAEQKEAVKIYVSGFELVPSVLNFEKDPFILEEAARLWIAGYKTGNYKLVPNTEAPMEFQQKGILSEPPASRYWPKTIHTLSDFTVMDTNLATYKIPPSEADDIGENDEPFEIYDNFNIADKITGNENWWTLVEYRRKLNRPGLNFYVDKVAQKRWLPTIGMPIPRPFLLRYLSEIPEPDHNAGIPDEEVTIRTMMPQESNYAAKPSHTSCSDGVWLVKHDNGVTKVALGGHVMTEADDNSLKRIAKSLSKNLHESARDLESFALKNASPGLVIEERFAALEADDKPALEFKIFCFWGRVWIANWRRGSARYGLIHRNGTVVDWDGFKEDHGEIPDWIEWAKVIEIAEKMAAHKDMFRVDMFVGLPAGSPALHEGATLEERRAAVEIVISEFEVHPTTKFKDPRLFDEAARLWIAGYKKLNIKEVPNDEVPEIYLDTAEFPAPPESREFVKTKHTTSDFNVAGVNLGPYRINGGQIAKSHGAGEQPFQLFEDFDISKKVTGNESWWDLITIRIGLKNRPGLPFYNDKVALRRTLPSLGISMPQSFVLRYKNELTKGGEEKDESKAISNMLPVERDFVAKPSHSCFGDDVWLVKHHVEDGKEVVSVNGGIGRQRLRPVDDFDRNEIGVELAKTLHLKPGTYGSWLYDHIMPGIVVEERFASIDDDDKPAVEFKVFTIWGNCYIAQWRRGTYSGIVYPDGSVVEWGKKRAEYSQLPAWVEWSKVKELAEKMGENKDMFRTDIFVGIPAGSPVLREGATEEDRRSAVQVVISEFEMQPGTLQMDHGIFDDAARLWIAGYKKGNYEVVTNTQVPQEFIEKGYLPEAAEATKS